jgi:NADH:ubiquinone oxidoreductase subunit E
MKMAFYRSQVLVCGGTGCTSSGSKNILAAFKEELKKNGIRAAIRTFD